jgi:glycosyltransferase involved in cell wall biosynthesis
MRVLHAVKTSEGALWAAFQARELMRRGVEVHVALPSPAGAAVSHWEKAGCRIHIADLSLPVVDPWRLPAARRAAQRLVDEVRPDLIHSHFVSTTMLLRLALGKSHPTPRILQVPGPLHLEHAVCRRSEIGVAGTGDFWIASSRCILRHYREAGVAPERVFLSYYGTDQSQVESRPGGFLRKRLRIDPGSLIVGDASYMYRPKYALGQFRGVKDHETLIDALGIVIRSRARVIGVLIGGAWGHAQRYEQALRRRAAEAGNGRLLMPGAWEHDWVTRSWPDFDCAVHVPLSENCGGVVEPLLAGVPTVAGQVGGLPEVVLNGLTGKLAPAGQPRKIAEAILEVLDDLDRYRAMAADGRALVREMFDVRRTAGEVLEVYRHILDPSRERPAEFDSSLFIRSGHLAPAPA